MSDSAYGWTRFGLNIASSVGCFADRMYMNSRTTFGTSQSGKTGNAYSRYYQMEGDKVVSVTHYGKGGIRQYALPHKHL